MNENFQPALLDSKPVHFCFVATAIGCNNILISPAVYVLDILVFISSLLHFLNLFVLCIWYNLNSFFIL